MSRDKKRLTDYLVHILEAIERTDRYTEDMGEVAFLENSMVQDAVVRNLEIIGEASNNVARHLAYAYQMRNAVAHGYFDVDLEIVWKTIRNDLPGLYRQVQQVLEGLPSEDKDDSTGVQP